MDSILLEVTKILDSLEEDILLQSPGDSPAHSQPLYPHWRGMYNLQEKQRSAIYLTNKMLTDGSGLFQLTHPSCTHVI